MASLMSISPRRQPVVKRRIKPFLYWGFAAFWVLGVIGILAGKSAIETYLRSERFQQFISAKSDGLLHARSEFAPFAFSGKDLYSETFQAQGGESAAFSKLRLDQIRAEVSWRGFFDHVWRIEQVSTQRLDVHFDGPRLENPSPVMETPAPGAPASSSRSWLPDRVEIGSASIRETNLFWGDAGSLRGTRLEMTPSDGGWAIVGNGGRLEQAGFPSLDVGRVQMRYQAPSIFVQSAELRQNDGGTVRVNGEINPGSALDLHAALSGISVTPLLAADWRVRLHGTVSGEIDTRTPLPIKNGLVVSGKLNLENGQLEALPVLDQIATFTRLQQFRTLKLTKASADFRQENQRTTVQNFVVESVGLIRMEGAFTVQDGKIDGVFEVGVTPSSLQWLPGSQERVFTQARGGYVWTPMRLVGPLDKPEEDLSPRLAAAAKGALIDGVEGGVRGTIETGKGVIKGALDLLFK
ncbi:MAG: hypothetical protein JWL90_4013 [Chthoniobacteraceae bacterium]|nr:hypothetical protein [Chthoniobacteraceae bacterium]